MSELIEAIDFPTVIAATHINALRSGDSPQKCTAFMQGYLGFDDHSRFTLEVLVNALSQPDKAGAFFINGVFGSGKSHLLGLLTLLGERQGHQDFLTVHPAFKAQLEHMPKRFAVYFSLDEYDGSRMALEEIVQREIELQARRCGFEVQAFHARERVSRSERFVVLEEELQAQGFTGLQLCIDELSLFLGAKDHRSLQAEASWLQFLGQRAARGSGFSYWCCFALQKAWEDVGDLEPYSLSQVRDRYQTLTLSMAHLPSLVERRLVHRKDPDAIHRLCLQSYRQVISAWPQIEFGTAEWESLYPFHPAALMLLEQIAQRFFSRTRSAVLFCATALKRYLREKQDETQRIAPPAIFNYFQPEFSQYAELRSIDHIWQSWKEAIPRIGRDADEKGIYQDLLKTLLLFRLSGRAVTAIQLGNTLQRDLALGGDENYRYIHQLLVRWCKEGDQLSLEKGEDWRTDNFSVNLGHSIKQTVRRLTRHSLETLQQHDSRIISTVMEACSDAGFPLQKVLSGPLQAIVEWHHSPRQIEIALWQSNTHKHLLNQLSRNARDNAKVLLFLGMPLSSNTMPDLDGLAARDQAAFLLWQPRHPTNDEWEFARETTARSLLWHDPALRDNRRGRSVIKYLENDLKERWKDIRNFIFRLYREGKLLCGDQRSVDVAELCHQDKWELMITIIAGFALEEMYIKYPTMAPAVKVLSATQVRQMGSQLLRQNHADCWWPPSLDRPVRAIAAPLGLVQEEKGRRRYAAGNDELVGEVESLLHTQTLPLSAIIHYLMSSSWGLMELQCELLLCGMLGAGRLEAVDITGKVLLPSLIKMPMQKNVYALRRAALMEADKWKTICAIIEILNKQKIHSQNYVAQLRVTEQLQEWAHQTLAELELTNARLRQLQQVTTDALPLWQRVTQVIDQVAHLANILNTPDSSLLEMASSIDVNLLQEHLREWRHLQEALDGKQRKIIEVAQRLHHPQITLPAELMQTKQRLQEQLATGEKVLFDQQFLDAACEWNLTFQEYYRHWHQQQYMDEHWNQLRAILQNPGLQALIQLTQITRYPFLTDAALHSELTAVLRKQCPRDGSLLPGEVTCNYCRLRYGQTLSLPDTAKFLEAINTALQRFSQLLQEQKMKSYLQRSDAGRTLLEWDSDVTTLLPLLTPDVLSVLEKAFAPRRQFQRSFRILQQQIGKGGTRTQLELGFKKWLEANEAVGEEDEIIVEDN